MSDKKQCIRCGRTIDAVARICPFCNWDQAEIVVPRPQTQTAAVKPVPGETTRIISTVQAWRFKPATEDGRPVSARFTVDLSFRGNL